MATDPTCAEDAPDGENQVALARGNAQVRDGGAAASSSTLSYKRALRSPA